jgi:predicted DNA binding CopG/RHH family protein
MKKLKSIPQFKNEDQERDFWTKNDSSDYMDWNKADKAIFPNLKASTKTISIRMSESLLHRIKTEANRQDVPYQSFIKVMLDKEMSEREKA